MVPEGHAEGTMMSMELVHYLWNIWYDITQKAILQELIKKSICTLIKIHNLIGYIKTFDDKSRSNNENLFRHNGQVVVESANSGEKE